MKKLTTILFLLFSLFADAQVMVFGVDATPHTTTSTDSAQFNFNLTARSVTDWADVTGHPHTGVRTATQNGITISTRSTSLWTSVSSTTAVQNGGQTSGTYSTFPQNVVVDYFFSNQTACADGNEQLLISGLQAGGSYTIQILGSRLSTAVGDATRNVVWVVKDANGRTTQTGNVKGNTSTLITFTGRIADASGNIYVGSYGANDTGGAVYGYFNGLKIKHE